MAVFSVTTTPVTLDTGSSYTVDVTNTGQVNVYVGPAGDTIKPGQDRQYFPQGASVSAWTVGGVGEVAVTPTAFAGTPPSYAAPNYGTRHPIPVASRNNDYYAGLFGSSSSQSFFSKHQLLADVTSLALDYGNFYGTGAAPQGDGPGDLTISCSVITLGGAIFRGYFGQTRAGVCKPGGVITGTVPFAAPKGTYFYVITYVSGNWPTGLTINYARGNGQDTVGDGLSDSGEGIANPTTTDVTATGTKSASTQVAYSPFMIRGTTRATNVPCVVMIGDSIAHYSNEAPDMGWFVRSVANQYPYVKITQPGETAQTWALNGSAASLVEGRFAALPYATHFIFAHGRNDLSGSRTLAQLQGDWITCWSRVPGKPAYQTTVTPKASSGGLNFTTLADQTTDASNAVRITVNAWLRDGAPMSGGAAAATGAAGASRCPVYDKTGAIVSAGSGPAGHPLALGGVLEVSDLVESTRDSGKWRVDRVRTVNDGATTTGLKPLTSATAAFTQADLGAGISVAGAGTAGAVNLGVISFVTNSTTVNQAKTPATTVSGALVQIGLASYDGTHPNGVEHREIAASAIKPVLDAAVASYKG